MNFEDYEIVLHFHHGGKIVDTSTGSRKTIRYEGGRVTKLCPFDLDKFCYFELKGYAKDFGYVGPVEFYYVKPRFDFGLMKIESDDDARQCIEDFVGLTDISVFCVHGIDTPTLIVVDEPPVVVDEPAPTPTDTHQAAPIPTVIDEATPTHTDTHQAALILTVIDETTPILTETHQADPIPNVVPSATHQWYAADYTDESTDSEYQPCAAELEEAEEEIRENTRELKRRGKKKVDVVEEEMMEGDEEIRAESDEEILPEGDEEITGEVDEEMMDDVESDDTDGGYESISDEEYHLYQEEVLKFRKERKRDRKNYSRDTNVGEGSGYVSEYDSDAEMEPLREGDEEVEKPKKFVKVDDRTNFKDFTWEVGMRFTNNSTFKEVVTRYSLLQGHDTKFTISNEKKRKFKVVCCKEQCPFHVYVSYDKGNSCYIARSVVNDHTCNRNMSANTRLKKMWTATFYISTFQDKPHWSANDLISAIWKDFAIKVSKPKAYRIKEAARVLLHGSMKDHYGLIWSYLNELNRSNSDSTFTLVTNPIIQPIPVFQRLFVFFEGLRRGFLEGCRRVLVIDAAFLKTFLGGTILAATGVDGNNQMFPVAWAVAEGENNDSWEWFMTLVKQAVETTDGDGWTIISDQHKAITHAVATVVPLSEHRNCARHIYANWQKQHRGEEMKELFSNVAYAYNRADFDIALELLRDKSHTAAEDLVAQNPKSFCRAFVKTETKCNYVVSNMAETFNSYIVRARAKHIIYMLEDIRLALMERMVMKRVAMEASTDDICPRIRKKLEQQRLIARQCSVSPSTETRFEIRHGLNSESVDMVAGTCSCRYWDLTGIPCCHVICAATWQKRAAEDYVHSYYKKEKYALSYKGCINACVGQKHWQKTSLPLDPPDIKVGPGRPKKNRRKDAHETSKKKGKLTRHGREMTCSRCTRIGHNKRSCTYSQVGNTTQSLNTRGGEGTETVTWRGRGEGGRRGRGRGEGGRRGRGRGVGQGRETGTGEGEGRGMGRRGGRGRGRGGGLEGWFNCGQGSVSSNGATSTLDGGPQATCSQASTTSSQQPPTN